MSTYLIEVSGAELDVVRLALGRMVEPKPAPKPREAVKRPTFPKPPRLPKGSPIGTWLEVDGLGECQVVCQGHAPGEYGVTNGRETAMVKLREGAVMSVRRFR